MGWALEIHSKESKIKKIFDEDVKIETISAIIHTAATTNGSSMRACQENKWDG